MTRQRLRSTLQSADPAPRLAAAQEQLQRRRRQRRQERIRNRLPVHTDDRGRLLPPPPGQKDADKPSRDTADRLADRREDRFPNRLGWESQALARALEAAHRRRHTAANQTAAMACRWLPSEPKSSPAAAPSPPARQIPEAETVRLYPDVGLALLRTDQAAAGRIWLLLRHLDQDGRGWVSLDQTRKQLAGKHSSLRVCGWRQLRNLLARGDGIFWKRDPLQAAGSRIWLRSVTRVAAALEVERLSLRPVAIPIAALLEGIGTVRAHLYASFHSARSGEAPIARATLRRLSSVSRRTQQQYERRAGVKQRRNWVVGPRHTGGGAQERAWQQGRAYFPFTDRRGKQGEAGATYLAWQLPNSYTGPHAPEAKGRQKQINRHLVDLFMKGITGNGRSVVDGTPSIQETEASPQKCFYDNGRAAVRGYSRDPETDAYWKSPHKESGGCIWHLIPGEQNGK
ncbi:MAG: hypothetical protein R3248_04900 [Candidatus Promineifilaceae bacterium]|nr:hypothetical protein [Candidatus Promineifilaceae bacterium]